MSAANYHQTEPGTKLGLLCSVQNLCCHCLETAWTLPLPGSLGLGARLWAGYRPSPGAGAQGSAFHSSAAFLLGGAAGLHLGGPQPWTWAWKTQAPTQTGS